MKSSEKRTTRRDAYTKGQFRCPESPPPTFEGMPSSIRRLRRYTLNPILEILRDSRAVGIIPLRCAAVSLGLSDMESTSGYAF